MNRTIAILGTGAIGSSVGADLSRQGYDVLLIDQWPAHVEAMKAHGLHITMKEEELHTPVRAIHLCELSSQRRQFDIVFLTSKSYDSGWMAELIKPYLKPDGFLVSLQNSLNDEWIAPIIGPERDVGSVVELSGELFEPGKVKRNTDRTRTWFAPGELHGRITPRLREVAQILSHVGVTEMTTNIWGAKWSKLVVNSMTGALVGILGIYNYEIAEDPELFRCSIHLGKESLQVATTLGFSLEPLFGITPEDFLKSTDEVLEKNLLTLLSNLGKQARNTILQDHLKGRRTEIEFINGLVVRKGKEARVPTPLNEAVTLLNRQIEQGKLKPGRSNWTLLREYTRDT